MLKSQLVIGFLLYSVITFSQGVRKDTVYNSSIIIRLSTDQKSITQNDLDTGFSVQTEDTSYRIISFCMTYPCKNQGDYALQQLSYQGTRAIVDRIHPRIWNETGFDFVAFDRILVEKNGQLYYAKAFLVKIKN